MEPLRSANRCIDIFHRVLDNVRSGGEARKHTNTHERNKNEHGAATSWQI
jgi:hypothetical protein